MKTRAHKYFALFAFGLSLIEAGGARLLWIRHEQRQDALVQQKQVRAQQQKSAQAQAAHPVAQNMLQDNIREPEFPNRVDELNSALSEAAEKGQVDRAKQLIKRGASVNRLDYEERDSALRSLVPSRRIR